FVPYCVNLAAVSTNLWLLTLPFRDQLKTASLDHRALSLLPMKLLLGNKQNWTQEPRAKPKNKIKNFSLLREGAYMNDNSDPYRSFLESLFCDIGSAPKTIEAEKIVRFDDAEGKPGNNACWAILFLGDRPAGAY